MLCSMQLAACTSSSVQEIMTGKLWIQTFNEAKCNLWQNERETTRANGLTPNYQGGGGRLNSMGSCSLLSVLLRRLTA